MAGGWDFVFSLKKQNSHVPACDRAVFIPVYFSAWAAYIVCQQGDGKGMDQLYQYTELESSRDLTWPCSAPASGAQLVRIGSRWREVWVGSEHRRNFGSKSGRRSLQHNGGESQDWKVHHCSTSGTQSSMCHRTLHAAMTAETTFVATVAKLKCISPNGFISFSFVRALFVCFCFCSALKWCQLLCLLALITLL